ncbi:DUF1559 domain-containing protein [Aeoliella sp.]|uniref:DUF1559 family PulG-like putative transporter n=1 Tax=Aeoliella sp. TaxID=2795800 RepID=UPI003CCBB97C
MPDNPYESTEQPHGKKQPRSLVSLLGRLLLYGFIIGVVIALLLPAKRSAREAARRNSCLNNMKMILLGLQGYHDANGELPPAYTVDDNGNRLHSWRTLILPYMEGTTVYKSIDLTKPWDDPANAEARESVVETYVCPSASYEDEHLTTYVAVVGPEFLFSGPTSRTFVDVSDGLSNTIAVVEIGLEHAVHWMSPEDVDENFVLNTEGAMETGHSGIFIAGFLDGHVEAIELAMDRNELRKMLTIAGRELSDE